MKQYDSYKDSGVEWIGKIPSHWGSAPIKYTVNSPYNSFIDGDWIESKVMVSDGIRYLTTGNVGALKYKEQGSGFISESTFKELNCSEVFPGDILISRLNEPIGRACIVPDLGYRIVVAVDNVIYRPDTDLYDKQFLIYQMNCKPYADMANFIARGSTMSRVSRTTLGHFQLIVPPLIEQKIIASYLDKKCGEIDKAIATQEKRVELLKELRQNIITQAVTRGINPNAPLKDSGVEWIGEVPEHWEIKRIKHVINLLTDYDANGSFADIAKNCKVNEGEPYAWMVRATDLENKRYGIVDGNNYCDLSTYKYLAKSSLKANDILIAKRGEIGKSYLVPQCEDPMTLAPNTYLLLTKKDVIDNIFFFNYLQSCGGVENLKILNKSTTLGALYKDDVKAMQIPVPPLSEQQEIVSYIEFQTARLDTSIEKAEHQIELLQELKQSIITEVVTGKRKVV